MEVAHAATGTDGYSMAFEGIAQSQDAYPVDFDQVWRWIEYSSKQKGQEALEANFVEGIDFLLNPTVEQKAGRGGHNRTEINITTDCFKQFCMMAGVP